MKPPTLMVVYNRMNIGGIQKTIIDFLEYVENKTIFKTILVLRKADGEFIADIHKATKLIDLKSGKTIFDAILIVFKLVFFINRVKPKKILTFADHISLLTLMAVMFFRTRNIKVIVVEGIYLSLYFKNQRWGWLRKILIIKLYPLAHKIIVQTWAQKLDLLSNFEIPRNKIRIIRNWVGNNAMEKISHEGGVDKKYDIIFIGRLEGQKNLFLFIDIIYRLQTIFPKISALIVGAGTQFDLLVKYAKKRKVYSAIKFIGFTKNPFRYLSSSKIFLLTSKYEGQPIAVLEAMLAKLPVVAFRSPGISETVINGRTGFVVSSQGEAVDQIGILLKDHILKLKMGNKASEMARKYFDQKNMNKIINYFT